MFSIIQRDLFPFFFFFFSSRRRHTRSLRDWSSDVCSSDLSPPRDHASHDPAARVAVPPERVHEVLARHVLADGFKLVYDTRASQGSWLVDALSGERYLDLYTFFASAPLGSNPRGLADD